MIGWVAVAVLVMLLLLRLVPRRRQPGPSAAPPTTALAVAPQSASGRVRGRLMQQRQGWNVRVRETVRSRGRLGAFVLFLSVIMAFFLALRIVGTISSDTAHAHLVVVVAPFTSADGQLAPEGRTVASDLITEWSQGTTHRLSRPLELIRVSEPIADADAALAIAQRHDADVVIWGSVEPGGTASNASLRPFMLWTPRTSLPHEQWPLGRNRLALPLAYDLAAAPLNGVAVLGPLLEALDYYAYADYDATLLLINTLLDRYSVAGGPLRPDLLLGLRGMIRWGQAQWTAAESDFRAAIEARSRPEYWNDLGAVLLMQGRGPDGVQALNQAQQLAQQASFDLPALYVNRGWWSLRSGDPSSALPDLLWADKLQPRAPAIIQLLAEAQRRSNNFEDAVTTLNAGLEVAADDPWIQMEVGRVRLAELIGEGDHIQWELEITEGLPLETLRAVREDFDHATDALEARATTERQLAASFDASGRPESGRVHEGVAQHLNTALVEARLWQGIGLTEEGIAASTRKVGTLRRMWNGVFGGDSPLEQAQSKLAALTDQQAQNYDVRTQYGRVLRVRGATLAATEQYSQATVLDPNRPLAWYGLAGVEWETNQNTVERNQRMREYLGRALDVAPAFAPGHDLLAQLEVQEQQWAAALPHLQWLAQFRPNESHMIVALAQAQRHLGDLAAAEQTLLPLANANNGAALVELARVYDQAGRADGAQMVLNRALDLDPNNAVAAYELGQLLQRYGQNEAARDAYQRAITANPNYMEAYLALGRLYGGVLNQPQAAVDSYRKAIETGGTDARNYEDLGGEFFEIGQYEEAAAALERSVALNPNSPEAQHALAQAYLKLGRYDAARERERAAIARSDGPYLDAQLGIAESLRLQGRMDDAITAYNDVLDQYPDTVGAYVGLGEIAADKQDWQTAIGYYNQALARAPDDTKAHFALGQALLEQGFYDQALVQFQLVLQTDAANAEAFYGAGRAQSRIAEGLYGYDAASAQQADAQALQFLNEALRFRPTYPEALTERGIIYERQGQVEAALADYQAATDADERIARAPFLQGKLALSLNDVDGATKSLQIAIARDSTNAEAFYWLGRAYRTQNQPRQAIRSFEQALEINGGYTEARYFQALTEQENDNLDAARTAYETIVAQAPAEDRWRQQAEERLRELGSGP